MKDAIRPIDELRVPRRTPRSPFRRLVTSLLRHPLIVGGVLVVFILGAGLTISGQAFVSTVGRLLTGTADDELSGANASTLALAPMSLGNQIAAATLQTLNPVMPSTRSSVQAPVFTHTVRVGRGDTLAGLLVNAGVASAEAGNIVASLRRVFDPRQIKPGHEIALTFATTANGIDPSRLMGLSFLADFRHEVKLTRDGGEGFTSTKEERVLDGRLKVANGTIRSSLFESAIDAGVPIQVLMTMIRAFSWDVDFQRDIHPGDKFEVLYEGFYDTDGGWVHEGRVGFAALTLSGKRMPLYLFTDRDGETDYYDPDGQSVRKALLKTPVDGARLSSGFGKRMHPILGYSLMHKGLDFAVPTGTPIYAAGNGTVEYAGLNGAYGNYVRIRHTDTFSTAYAHMSRFATGMGSGKRVSQGQIIGYVGTTGRSTGPHLHFEVLQGKAQVNPMTVKFPSGQKLAGQELARFVRTRDAVNLAHAALVAQANIAQYGD